MEHYPPQNVEHLPAWRCTCRSGLATNTPLGALGELELARLSSYVLVRAVAALAILACASCVWECYLWGMREIQLEDELTTWTTCLG